ncbi:hypothetical protein ACYSNX_13010 [Myroides sp. LJL115]
MNIVENSNIIQFHYYFKDDSHSINSILRNECEKEILFILKEISDTLNLEVEIETLPTEEGGFKEKWILLGKNAAQISLIVSVATIIISRFPVENEELTNLQIENLKLDNELKRRELEKLNLEFIQDEDKLSVETVKDSIELTNKNYKISWRKSNLYKKLKNYNKVDSIDILRLNNNNPVGSSRRVSKNEFFNFILKTDELPNEEIFNAKIDVISPAIKRGKFKWKGFYENNIINFLLEDYDFNSKVLNGDILFSNRYSIEADMIQERKINTDGNVIVTNSIIKKVNASIEGEKRIEY